MRPRKLKGARKVSYELIDRQSVIGQPIYKLLRELVKAHHEEIIDARIAVAWCTSWRPDVDGRVILGKCVKASDLHRELAPFDFVILLRKSFWQDLHVSPEQRTALLDHELCHATVRLDDRTLDPVLDERGRKVYRVRKHDIEEFRDVVARYGCYKSDLEQFAKALLERASREPFEACAECRDSSPGWIATTVNGTAKVARCACYLAWAERRQEALAS